MKNLWLLALLLPALCVPAHASIYVVTTDTNLADIARHVGGSRVQVESLSRGVDDPHQVEPRPSMVVKMSRAQLFVRNGMDLDMWADGILDKSSNAQVMRGAPGYVDCSQGITKLEVPSGKLNPSMGDIHVYGNPHYLMDPASGIIAAQEITLGLMRVDPAGKDYYKSQYDLFAHQLVDHIRMWQTWLAPYRGAKIVIYHEDWAYFFHRFDLVGFGTMEPKPGMPPSPGHVDDLIRQMKDAHVKVMLLENFRSHRYPDRITAETGATAVYVPLAVEGSPEATNYFMLFDTIITRLVKALHG